MIGVAYFAFVKLTGWGIPCIFHMLTGLYCPGCGISRMFFALARLDLQGAFAYNALVMVLLPFAVVFGLRRWWIYVKSGNMGMDKLEKFLVIPALLLTLAFGIMRNMDAFSFLAPA